MAGASELITLISRLVRVVELIRQISGIVGMQYVVGISVLDCPDDAILRTIGGNTCLRTLRRASRNF